MSSQRPLVMRCGAFGDMVLLTALLRQLHSRLGTPADVIASGSWSVPLLQGQPGVGEIFTLRSRKSPYWASRSQQLLVRWLRSRSPGPTWFCDSGAGRELLRRGGVADDFVCEDQGLPRIPGEHFVDRWIRFAETTPPAFADMLPPNQTRIESRAVLSIDAAARGALELWLARRGLANRDLILLQTGNKRTMRAGLARRATNTKYWPPERWAEVIRALRDARPDAALVLMGVPREFALNAAIMRRARVAGLHNAADDLPIRILLPLLERATSLVSVDTGPAHAAAALNCPTVALFGASDPLLYRPGGVTTPAIALVGEIDGHPNILGIQPPQVIAAWHELTSRSRSRRGTQSAPVP
jgi:heptosyltransferase-2/heptosyltransferase-3